MSKEIEDRTEIIAKQKTLYGKEIEIREFKNLEEKRKLKAEVLKLFNGEMIRSIITPRDLDNNMRLNKLDRKYRNGNQIDAMIDRVDSFAKKTMDTISTFPSLITSSFINLLTEEEDKVYDAFMGHNSRAEDVLSFNRKYYAYDIHTFPVEFTKKAIDRFPKENYELNLGSSEKSKYPDEYFDFSITCPPYFEVEPYNKLYNESKKEDLSSKSESEFLNIYKNCLNETYRVLKKGSYFVIVVGDTHKGNRYRSLMIETINICEKAGFLLHDINIYNRKSNIGGDLNYKNFILKSKRFPTIHEFILVFYKPAYPSKKQIKIKEKPKDENDKCALCGIPFDITIGGTYPIQPFPKRCCSNCYKTKIYKKENG